MYARTDYVADIPTNAIMATDLQYTLARAKNTLYPLLTKGDVLVIPLFRYSTNISAIPRKKRQLLENKAFSLDQEATDLSKWKEAKEVYEVLKYTVDYEPITISSKAIQPW
jgi:hypothetical protein